MPTRIVTPSNFLFDDLFTFASNVFTTIAKIYKEICTIQISIMNKKIYSVISLSYPSSAPKNTKNMRLLSEQFIALYNKPLYFAEDV